MFRTQLFRITDKWLIIMQRTNFARLLSCHYLPLTLYAAIASATTASAAQTIDISVERYRDLALDEVHQTTEKPIEPVPQYYARTTAGREAARFAESTEPAFGAAHALSMVLELDTQASMEQQAMLAQYGPWLTHNALSLNSQQLIRFIQDAAIHGLNPNAYELQEILRTLDTLTHLDKPSTQAGQLSRTVHLPGLASLRTQFSSLMETAFISLASHLGQGTVEARATQHKLYRDPPTVDTAALLERLRDGQLSVQQALNSVAPTHPEYYRLTQRLRDLLTERATGVERTVINKFGTLQRGEYHDDVLNVKQRLVETGDMPLSTVLTPFFDADLLIALQKIQKEHGLEQSGQLDIPTRKALNESIHDEITAIALSLERWRWMPRELGQKHIFVNVPDYQVMVRDGTETLLSMVAVVGTQKNQTPSFSQNMSYMEFNPTWTVPAKITNNELIPTERRKPGYLASKNFDFLKREGNQLVQVPRSQVTSEDFNKSSFPYLLRQRGGPTNALGRMKFMMPNPYAIYLHDTQAKRLFSRTDRAFSHGCVRLSEPDRLAQLLMSEDGYGGHFISKTLARRDTHRVRLRTTIPTHLTYMTTWIDNDGVMQQRPDIYNHDAALIRALRQNNTLLATLSNTASDKAGVYRLASDY